MELLVVALVLSRALLLDPVTWPLDVALPLDASVSAVVLEPRLDALDAADVLPWVEVAPAVVDADVAPPPPDVLLAADDPVEPVDDVENPGSPSDPAVPHPTRRARTAPQRPPW